MDTLLGQDTKLLADGKDPQKTCSLSDLPKEGVIGLYFSAHWCPPCRGYTPKLAEAYKTIVAAGKSFQVIFVSSDKGEKEFLEYFAEQPWLALPFEKRDLKASLSKKYKVSGIPSLILLDAATGKVITKNGREALGNDSEGKKFPWTPPTLADALGDVLVKTDGTEVKREEALAGKYVGIYFSAHWCPPCKGFTPKLVETYKKIQAARSDFEIVFVSSDRDEAAFKEYFAEMPWLAQPYANRDGKDSLSSMFEVEGIPTFVILGPDGKTITTDAREKVSSDPEGAEFPWLPKPVEDVDVVASALNETTAMVAFCASGQLEATRTAMTPHAEEVLKKAAAADEDPELVFCVAASTGEGIAGRVRELCKLEAGKDALVLLDIPDNGGFYAQAGAVDAASIAQFLQDFRAKKLARQQLS